MKRLVLLAALLAGCAGHSAVSALPSVPHRAQPLAHNSAIQHVVIIEMENRSFDHLFGTYPGANGIPMVNGVPNVNCNPDPATGKCVLPYHDTSTVNQGGETTLIRP